jgi:hypothetical protein
MVTDVAPVTFQSRVADSPVFISVGLALKATTTGGVAGCAAGGCVMLTQPVIVIRSKEARTNNFFITHPPYKNC